MESRQASQVTGGLIVVAVGLILLAGQTETGWRINFGRLWPIVFFLIGVGKFVGRNARAGVWFFCLGGIFLLHTYRILTLNDSWPLFIVMAGVSMLFPQMDRDGRKMGAKSGTDQPADPRFNDGRFES